ncbi:LON peptidase substrate-binding domain-containing protein [Spongiimicrobium sp. 3-5]|uniref:LON peptidase substrate-binding domain-containing protein n=1 Tax=Spongiimicrobium sp. 3-5 TaxID=3332596 RepID=UPI00398161D2
MKLSFFPLPSVFFPGERVPLHVFEERYKQLIADCREYAYTFGMPVYIDNVLAYGTEMQLEEIMNTYDNGEMDIICSAKRVFKMVTFENQLANKLYAGGVVEFLENVDDGTAEQKQSVLGLIGQLYALMGVPLAALDKDRFTSFSLAHKVGLTLGQEHHLLQISHESGRLAFLEQHLRTTIPVLRAVNRTKETIELNGHFRNFDPLDFEDFKI